MVKRLMCVLFVLALVPMMAFADAIPADYDILYVTDVFPPELGEIGEDGEAVLVETSVATLVQGCFGKIDMSNGEDNMEFIGFDETDTRTLGVAPDAQIQMPADWMDPVQNAPCSDLVAWYEDVNEAYMQAGLGVNDETGAEEPYSFYATYTVNEDGDLTKLEYMYLP